MLDLVKKHQRLLQNTSPGWGKHFQMLEGSLDILYRVSTCADQCRGGDHQIERLVGRAYNLSIGAVALIDIGLYDEALCLVRQMGEIVNLLALFRFSTDYFNRWCSAPRSMRLSEFSPAAVRDKVRSVTHQDAPLEAAWYRELCEQAVHVTPSTAPNAHNENNTSMVGGCHQIAGREIAISHLANVANWVAICGASLTGPDHLFDLAVETGKES
jgi:hypothetical protein